MKRIAVLTSGGDAPGMNAAIRAVVRTGVERGWSVLGVRNGYAGLMAGTMRPLGPRDVSGVIQQGGTMLKAPLRSSKTRAAARGDPRAPAERRRRARRHRVATARRRGTLSEMGFPVVVWPRPSTTTSTAPSRRSEVGTALNVALEAIDRLKVTAASHQRAFLVEIMGRECGYLALMAGIAGGAEAVVIPEVECDPEDVASELREAYDRGKSHALVVVAEGAAYNGERLVGFFRQHQERLGFEPRLTVLGHVQRGGAPGASDRLLGTELGVAATERLARGEHGCLVGWLRGEVTATALAEVVTRKKALDPRLFELARVLAR
jgi:6-phosphofructokinase 1